jgi:hypothetical protein
VLSKIGDVLNIPVTELTGDPPAVTDPHSAEHELIVAIRTMLSGHDFLVHLFSGPTSQVVDEGHRDYDDRSSELWKLAHASRYTELATVLPDLITEAEADARTREGESRGAAFRLVAIAYQVGAAVVAKLGQHDMAWVMADRSIMAAERSDDPLLAIAGDFRLGHAFLSGGKPTQALRAAESGARAAAVRAGQGDASALRLFGALKLVSAISQARLDNEPAARDALSEATRVARTSGLEDAYGTEFGHANVEIHAVAVAVELGRPSEALRRAAEVDVTALSIERRGRFLIDVARAYGQNRDTAGAVRALVEAEALTPQQVANHWAVRELVADLLRRERIHRHRALHALASRIGLIT